MIFFFFFRFILNETISINDIAFGIWSGKKMLNSRVLGLAKTWIQLIPEMHVYSDFLPEDSIELIYNSSKHLNLYLHAIPTFAHYLVGTTFDDVWNHAQTRHLIAFSDLYNRFPNKKWYFLGDDDTFLFPNSITEHLSNFDSNEMQIHGHLFFSFQELEIFFINHSYPHRFAQGGAGFFISQKMMNFIGPKILNCSSFYESFNFVSDIRISACIERESILNNLSKFDYYEGFPNIIHNDIPEKSISKNFKNQKPITYHHIVPPLTERIWNSSYSTWTLNNNTDVFVDWSHITMSEFFSEIGNKGNFMFFQWGYQLGFTSNKESKNNLKALTQLEPIFNNNLKENIKYYYQIYENNILIKYFCNNNISKGELIFHSFYIDSNYEGSNYLIYCEKPQQFLYNYNNSSPYHILKLNQSDL